MGVVRQAGAIAIRKSGAGNEVFIVRAKKNPGDWIFPKGHIEPEGPYGEYVGYYGVVKKNPVFHLTAITHRKDALFQTVTIGGKHLGRTDTAQLTTVKTESAAWAALVTYTGCSSTSITR